MDGLTFIAGSVGVDNGAEWHEQLNLFMEHRLSVFYNLHFEAITGRAKCTLSNSAVTVLVHHKPYIIYGMYV